MNNANPATKDGSSVISVIGTDTYLGAHMQKHLSEKFQFVYGYSQYEKITSDFEPIPINEVDKHTGIPSVKSDWFVICIDPNIGFMKYVAKLKKLFDNLERQEIVGDICFLSSSTICMPDGDNMITENTLVYPCNEQELALATGENLLKVLSCSQKGYIVPHIMRLGIPYGDEIGMENQYGFINKMRQMAERGMAIKIPITGSAQCSLAHISDICNAAILLMGLDNCPPLVNIPGENMTIGEVATAISNRYHVGLSKCGLCSCNDTDFFVGNQRLSDEYFNTNLRYKKEYSLGNWLNEIQDIEHISP